MRVDPKFVDHAADVSQNMFVKHTLNSPYRVQMAEGPYRQIEGLDDLDHNLSDVCMNHSQNALLKPTPFCRAQIAMRPAVRCSRKVS